MVEPGIATDRGRRNHQLDLLRILFATLVLLSHAPELTDGNRSREIFSRLTHSSVSFGVVGVDGFFLLSGFLIVQSWLGDSELLNFLRKRVLRIVPGYLVAVLLSTVVIGLLAPAVPHFFRHLGRWYFETVLMLSSPITPPVLSEPPSTIVNGSLWTIAYEFRCYLLVAVFGLCGILRRPAIWLACTALLFFLMVTPSVETHLEWHRYNIVTGESNEAFRLTSIFFVGGCFYLFRQRIRFRPLLAFAAAALLVAVRFIAPAHLEPALVLCGAYLMFYIAHLTLTSLDWMARFPDISYGIYLYGWPVECLWIWYNRGSPWVTFFVSAAICFALGWLSWVLVERPMLTFKRRATAPLPPP